MPGDQLRGRAHHEPNNVDQPCDRVMSTKAQVFPFALLLTLWGSWVDAHSITMVKDLSDKRPAKVFDCHEKVIIYLRWGSLPSGPHTLKAEWHLPSGDLQEQTIYPFRAPVTGSWLWLEIQESPRGFIFSVLPRRELNGLWQVKLFLDGQPLSQETFPMTCDSL